MPVIAAFYGLIVTMYFEDSKQLKWPHIHVKYEDEEAIFRIPYGDVLSGNLPPAKLKLVSAWIEIHKEELMADWQLTVGGQQPYQIEPLK